jgi:hypothetical protein
LASIAAPASLPHKHRNAPLPTFCRRN